MDSPFSSCQNTSTWRLPRGNDESPSLVEHGLQHPSDVPGFRPSLTKVPGCEKHGEFMGIYPLVNVDITMDNRHVSWLNPLLVWPSSIAILTRPGGLLGIGIDFAKLMELMLSVGWIMIQLMTQDLTLPLALASAKGLLIPNVWVTTSEGLRQHD